MNEVRVRDLYTLKISPSKISRLLSRLEESQIYHNVVGDFAVAKCGEYLVKIVIGTVDPDNVASGGAGTPDNLNTRMTNTVQNESFVAILKSLSIDYEITKAIQIMNFGVSSTAVPGLIYTFYNTLYCGGVNVLSQFMSRPYYLSPPQVCECNPSGFATNVSTYIFEVAAKDAAKAAALATNADGNSKTLCINKFNVGGTYCLQE